MDLCDSDGHDPQGVAAVSLPVTYDGEHEQYIIQHVTCIPQYIIQHVR